MALTVERLREVLNYDPETGLFTWLVASARRQRGQVAGHPCKRTRYILIGIDGRLYHAARLAVFWMQGRWPKRLVDHRDGVRGNNEWTNLRECGDLENAQNKGIQTNNALGVKGVWFYPKRNRFIAQIKPPKRGPIMIGRFKTIEEASAAYQAAALKYFGEFARAN